VREKPKAANCATAPTSLLPGASPSNGTAKSGECRFPTLLLLAARASTLAHALLREDAGFHAYQMLEAGVRQFGEWGYSDRGRHILVAVARYLAAHSPTERSAFQTADIAQRLLRGGELHQGA
jgi:hypothetical protein